MPPNARVGKPGSLVKPGQPVPGKPGHYYESGQYAPSPAHLTALKLSEMQKAGLLPETGLDIFDDNGEISEEKLEQLNLKVETDKYGIEAHSPELPAFAFVGLASVFYNVDKEIFPFVNLSYLDWVADTQMPIGGSIEDQTARYSEMTDVTSRNLLTGYSRDPNGFKFAIYQPYFVYLSVPILPAIQGITTGLNVSTVSTLKTLGHIVYDRVRFSDKSMFEHMLQNIGWERLESVPKTKIAEYALAGSEIGYPKKTKWLRSRRMLPVSAVATLGPRETFSEMFMYYYVHRVYLEKKDIHYVDFMTELIAYMGRM